MIRGWGKTAEICFKCGTEYNIHFNETGILTVTYKNIFISGNTAVKSALYRNKDSDLVYKNLSEERSSYSYVLFHAL